MADNGRRALVMAREKRRWTQDDVAERMHVHKSVVSKLETGKRRLDVKILDRYLEAVELTPRQYCRLVDILEEADEQSVAYPATQATLPFADLRESATGRREGERPAGRNDLEIDAAARNLMDDVRVMLRCVYRREFLAGE